MNIVLGRYKLLFDCLFASDEQKKELGYAVCRATSPGRRAANK